MTKQNSFTPPQPVRAAAERGLELHRRYSRGAVDRAQVLAKGKPVTYAQLARMKVFFDRHEGNNHIEKREADGGPTAGTIAWLSSGGEEGRDWVNRIIKDEDEKHFDCEIAKVDNELGIVFGYAIICKELDSEYYDTQGDHIVEQAMLEATAEYMSGDRIAKDMHQGDCVGQVVFGFPLTTEIAKALGISCGRTGFIVGMQPDDEFLLNKYSTGEYTGFSIGGRRIAETIIEE